MRLFTLTLLLLITTSLAPAAENDLSLRFRNAALTAVQRAESRGVVEIQGLALSDLKKGIQTGILVNRPDISFRTANRNCARWSKPIQGGIDIATGEKINSAANIYINPSCANLSGEELEGIALHEFLGMGFDTDHNYEITTELLIKKSPSNGKYKLPNMRSGGSTGVGGGGDEDDLRFKIAGLRFIQKTNSDTAFGIPQEILEHVIRNMKISPASDINKALEYRPAGLEGIGSQAVIYVHSEIYRSRSISQEDLGVFAVVAAQVFATFSAEDFGIAEYEPSFAINLDQVNYIKKHVNLRFKP